jgi:hypothetical protein
LVLHLVFEWKKEFTRLHLNFHFLSIFYKNLKSQYSMHHYF